MANILNLPSLEVLEVKEDLHHYQIKAESTLPVKFCPACYSGSIIKHGIHPQLFMDVPNHGKRTGITVVRRRFRCKSCGKTFMEELPCMDEKRLATKRLVEWVQRRSLDKTFASLSEETGLDEKSVRNIFRDYVAELEKSFKLETPRWLGIDEVHLTKKPRGVLTNIETRTIVDMLSSSSKESVLMAFSRFRNPKTIEFVTMDMWTGYRNATREVFPWAKVIIDKFHVVRLANDGLNAARISIRDGMTMKQRRKMLGDRFAMLSRPANLTPKQEFILDGLLKNYPILAEAYEVKEAFFRIYDAPDRESAIALYNEWLISIPSTVRPHFGDLISATTNWNVEIFNYFDTPAPLTNALTEALNGLIKIIHRNGRGYSFEAIRAKFLFTDAAHKKVQKRSFRASQGILGFTRRPDELDYGTHILTLLRLLQEAAEISD